MTGTAPPRGKCYMRTAAKVLALAALLVGHSQDGNAADPAGSAGGGPTATPIQHVIIIIGENRSFDHLFGLYRPRPGQTISNLLSKGIVNADGTPGPHFADAAQSEAGGETSYFIAPRSKTPYATLPPPDLNKAPAEASDGSPPPFASVAAAAAAERDLEPSDVRLLTTGASGLDSKSGADTRVAQALQLPNGPFPLRGPKLPYDSYTGDTIHRFFQMWQQSDCSAAQASKANPSGCLSDLYAFVAVSASARNQGGGTASAFYNVNDGAAPYLKRLADDYTMSDNYHQAQMGGTMVEHFFLMAADDLFYSDGHGTPASPPPAMIADPDPRPGTPNRYRLDGWYSKCADPSQPGVGAIVAYLKSLQPPIDPNCAAGHYYAINNLFPAYNADGTPSTSRYAVPPSGLRTIGEALSEKGVSWRYYGGMFDRAVAGRPNRYCALCNSFQFSASIMGNQAARAEHLKDVQDLYGDIARGSLPAVAYVKPDEFLDGHPASSKVVLFEAFTRRIVETLQANPALFARSAVFVTFDEGGGYYDSGYIQPLDFQGDGPRIPFIVVSPFAKGGRVVHSYCDHASVVKFIERNWRLAPLSKRSRDNLPNPVAEPDNPYVPVNRPAICDLFDMFEF